MYEQKRKEVNKAAEKFEKQLKAAKKSGSKANTDKVCLSLCLSLLQSRDWLEAPCPMRACISFIGCCPARICRGVWQQGQHSQGDILANLQESREIISLGASKRTLLAGDHGLWKQ